MSVPHRRRPAVEGVVHVSQKIRGGLPRLRNERTFGVIAEAVRAGNVKPGFRVCAFTVMSNHFHFLVEARGREALARGMNGLSIRVAKALNRLWGRRGRVFAERYFARAARGARAIRRALVYVVQNARKHGVPIPRGRPDPFSSGAWAPFWRTNAGRRREPCPVARPRDPTLDLVMAGGIGLDEVPAR